MPNTVESLGFIKWYSLSSSRPIKIPRISIRYNCQKICSLSKRPNWKTEKRPHFCRWSTSHFFTSFWRGPAVRPSNNLENKIPSDAYWRNQLACMKVQVHSPLEPLLKYIQDQTLLPNQGHIFKELSSYKNNILSD